MSTVREDNRLDLRIDPELKRRVKERADFLGQSMTVFTERALKAALDRGMEKDSR